MDKKFTKLIYKPNPQSTNDFIMLVDPEELKKYRDGDTSVPLTQIYESDKIFHSGQGNQGILLKVSDADLDNGFPDNIKTQDARVQYMFDHGVMQHAGRIGANDNAHLNMSRGTGSVQTR